MKQFFSIFYLFVVLVFLSCNTQQIKSDFSNDIQPFTDNLKYWQYKGKPVLLLGATNNDNLFQSPDIKEQLDLLQSIGGIFVSIRKVESLVKMWDVEPLMELLSEREEDEAYLTGLEGERYVLLFPAGGSVKMDLSLYDKQFGECGGQFTVSGGSSKVEITAPDSSGWFAVITLI